MKALVINTTRMGDLIQSTPLMQSLQAQGYEVSLLYSDGFEGIATMLAGVDHLVPLSLLEAVNPLLLKGVDFIDSYKFLAKTLSPLRDASFDLVVNATHSAYSAVLTGIVAGKATVGLSCDSHGKQLNTSDWGRYYLTSQSCRESNRFNLVDIHRMMAGVNRAFPVKLKVPASAQAKADEILGEEFAKECKLIGIVPGASTLEKTLPVESFAATIQQLQATHQIKVLIFGAKSEAVTGAKLATLLPGSLDLCGKTDVATLSALISRCDLLLSNDTGPMHIAAAVGTTVVDISLGSALASETALYGEGHYVIESTIGCHPCLPRMHCTHFSCGRSILPSVIARVAEAALNGREPLLNDYDNLSDVNIYRTSFDQDGLLELVPLLKRAASADDLLYDAMKEVWKEALLQSIPVVKTYHHSGSGLEISAEVAAKLPSIIVGFVKVEEIAGIGARSCEELVKLAEDPARIETMKQLADAIQNIDRGLAQIAYAIPSTMPFLTQFTSAKADIRSVTLTDHAAKTAILFQNLGGWCRSLIEKLELRSNKLKACSPHSFAGRVHQDVEVVNAA